MPPYRAQLGGIEGSGVYERPSHQLPIGDALRAISEGGTSLIQGAFMRKIAMRRVALEEQRLAQEGELHKAQLEAITAYRTAALGNQRDRIQAPDARKTKANGQAFNSLQKEFPDHPYVQPDESGATAQFDPDNQQDYVGALKAARGEQAKHDAVSEQQANRIALFEKADAARQTLAGLRETWKQEDTKAKGVALTPAQLRMRKNDLLTRLAKQFDGDPDAMAKFLGSDPGAKADAETLGIKDYEIKGAAGVVSSANATRDAGAARSIFSSGMAPSPAAAASMVPSLKPVPRVSPKPEAGPGANALNFGGDTALRALTGKDTGAGNGAGPIDLGAPPRASTAGSTAPPPLAPIAPVGGLGAPAAVTPIKPVSPAAPPAGPPAPVTPITARGPLAAPATGTVAPAKRLIETQAQYDALRKGGTGASGAVHPPMTDADIGARYDVHPSVKRAGAAAPVAPITPVPPATPVARPPLEDDDTGAF